MIKRIRLLRRAGAIRAAARHGLADVAQAHALEERVWDLEPLPLSDEARIVRACLDPRVNRRAD